MPELRQIPLLFPAGGFVIGLAIARVEALHIYASIGLALVLMVLFGVRIMRGFSVALIMGLLWGGISLFWDARQIAVEDTWLHGPTMVTARVESVQSTSSYTRLRLTQILRHDGASLAGKADLYIYDTSASGFRVGNVISATARWHTPRNRLNPGGFDYQAYCFDRHIALIGSARSTVNVMDSDVSLLEDWRQDIRNALTGLPDARGGIIRALLLADRSHIPIDVEEAFAASGAAHLLAISGLHVGMAAGWLFVLCWCLLTCREAWIVNLPVRAICLLAGVFAAGFYATLAGWPLPAQRAVLMLAAAALAWWLQARVSPLNSMCAALILILCIDPQAVTSISLWMSFLATSALLLWAGGSNWSGKWRLEIWQIGAWLKALFWVSAIATLATLPLVADVFGRLPVYSLLANILLVPLYGLLVLPLALLGEIAAISGLYEGTEMLLRYSGAAVAWGNQFLLWLHHYPLGNVWIPDVPLWAGLAYVFGMMIAGLLLWKGQRFQAAICTASVLALYAGLTVFETDRGHPEWVVWDVGQGAASSLLLPDNKVMVVDVPGRRGSRFNGGTSVAAGLRALGATHVDVLVLSHAQSDHMGGALRLLDRVNHIEELWLSEVPQNHADIRIQQLVQRIRRQGGKVRWLAQGRQLRFGDALIRVLWPPGGYAPANDNNDSLVLSVRLANGFHLLMPGDIEADVERRLLHDGLDAHDAILVPHHGSRTSSTPALVRQVNPAMAIMQTGYENRYGFPKPDIVARYRKAGAAVWNSVAGAVHVRWAGSEASITAAPEVRQFQSERATKREYALQWWQSHL